MISSLDSLFIKWVVESSDQGKVSEKF